MTSGRAARRAPGSTTTVTASSISTRSTRTRGRTAWTIRAAASLGPKRRRTTLRTLACTRSDDSPYRPTDPTKSNSMQDEAGDQKQERYDDDGDERDEDKEDKEDNVVAEEEHDVGNG